MRKQDLMPYFGSKKAILGMFPAHQHRGGKRRERHVYVDHGAPLLLVAHIDTVQTPRLDRVNRGAGFDDRLGVYLGHKLVQERPDLFDLLLTDYEESGGSTAAYFTPSHDYHLVVELDREGEDYVDYGLSSYELRQALDDGGFEMGQGIFSDICVMDQVECNKINLGLGTYNGHSKNSGFDVNVFYRQVRRLLDFAELHRDAKWPEAVGDDRWKFHYEDTCDACLNTVPSDRLSYNYTLDRFECPRCSQQLAQFAECESCGDPHSLDDLVYDPLYGGFLCATCSYVLHTDDEELVLEGL